MVAQKTWMGIYAAIVMETIMNVNAWGSGAEARKTKNLIDFTEPETQPWMIVNDTVMGGVSSSSMEMADSVAVFSGTVSLENGGGFVSMRTLVSEDLSGFAGLELKVRGDGKVYQLRLRTDRRFDWVAYRSHFETRKDTWTLVRIPFTDFEPTYRGRVLDDHPELDPVRVRQIGFLLCDAQEGDFRLEVAWVRAYG